jgi:hypothetical protein
MLIIPSSWGSQLGAHLHTIKQFFWHHCRGLKKNNLPRQLGVVKQFFWRRCQGLKKNNLPRQLGTVKEIFGTIAGKKEDFSKGSLSLRIFYFVIVLLYFIFTCIFLSKIQKN